MENSMVLNVVIAKETMSDCRCCCCCCVSYLTCFDQDWNKLEVSPQDGVVNRVDSTSSQPLMFADDGFHRFNVVSFDSLFITGKDDLHESHLYIKQ